ncbi:hypothetical protein CP985_14510, partial [Malaciobacter mytili LMG 24559]
IILFLFIIFTYISSLWSSSFKDAFSYVNSFHKYYFLFIPVLFTSLNVNEAKNCIKVLVFSFFSYSVFSLLIFLGLFEIVDNGSNIDNPKGIMGYAIVTQYMLIGTIASFIFAIFSKKEHKIFYYTMSIVCFFSLFVNNSRTAQVSLILSIITIFIIYYKKELFNIKKLLISLLVLVSVLTISFFIIEKTNKMDRFENALNQIKKIYYTNKFDGSLGLRIYFNKVGIEALKEHPLLGFGPEDNVEYLKNYQENDKNYTYQKIFSTYHSEHFDLITRYGLIGYFLLVLSILYLIYKLKNINKEYYLISLCIYVPIFYISLANATFAKKPINYILISVFVLLSVIAYRSFLENKDIKDDNITK